MAKNRETLEGHAILIGPIMHGWTQAEGGLLPDGDMRFYSHAAAYFCKIAHTTLQLIPEQVTMEDETDTTISLRQQLDSVMIIYGVDDIEKLMNLMPICRLQAFRMGKTWDERFQLWLDSGGQKLDEVTREEAALSKTNNE
jgi:hypothetical protein